MKHNCNVNNEQNRQQASKLSPELKAYLHRNKTPRHMLLSLLDTPENPSKVPFGVGGLNPETVNAFNIAGTVLPPNGQYKSKALVTDVLKRTPDGRLDLKALEEYGIKVIDVSGKTNDFSKVPFSGVNSEAKLGADGRVLPLSNDERPRLDLSEFSQSSKSRKVAIVYREDGGVVPDSLVGSKKRRGITGDNEGDGVDPDSLERSKKRRVAIVYNEGNGVAPASWQYRINQEQQGKSNHSGFSR